MAKFEVVSIEDAKGVKERLVPYVAFIAQLSDGQAGKLVPDAGETLAAVRRRLGAAARSTDTKIGIRRADDAVFFWKTVSRRRRQRTAA